MTIENASDARLLTMRSKWTLEKLLEVVEGEAADGENFVFVQGRLSNQLQKELGIRGFAVELDEDKSTIRW